jgi:hypothetical protein
MPIRHLVSKRSQIIVEVNATDIEQAVKDLSVSAKIYGTYEDYYNGKHAFNFSSDKFKKKFWRRLRELRENLCAPVVDVPGARLEVISFGARRGDAGDPSWQIWKRNLMPHHSRKLHRQALKTGDGFVIVWPDPDLPNKARIYVQDESSTCGVWKDPETGKILFGAKAWRLNGKYFMTLYYPDRIMKFQAKDGNGLPEKSSGWIERADQPSIPNPFGVVPMFHFTIGKSQLQDVIPLNDALNKTLADTMVGMEYNSTRQRWTAGITFPTDPETGKPIVPFEHDDQWVTTSSPDGKIGQFNDMDLGGIGTVSNDFRKAVARVSGVPEHFFFLGKGDFPSGDAQRKAEARLIDLVTDCQLAYGEPWAAVMKLALRIEKAQIEGEIEVGWSDAAQTGEKEALENAMLKKELGWSLTKIQEELGLSEADILEMADQKAKETKSLGSVLGTAFDQGQISELGGQPA